MTIKIDLPEDAARRLERQAAANGLAPSEYARRLLEAHFPSPSARGNGNQATLDLFERWAREDATDDPEELERRNRDYEQFMQEMDEQREREGVPRKLYP